MASSARPLLTAFGWTKDARGAYAARIGPGTQLVVAALGGCVVLATLMYGADVEPILKIKTVEFTEPDVAVIVLLVVVLARCLLKGFHALPRPILLPMVAYFLACTASTVVAGDKVRALAALVQIAEFAVLIWCMSLLTSGQSAMRLLHLVLVVFVFESLLGVWQFLLNPDPVLPWAHGTFLTNQKYSQFVGASAAIAYALFAGSDGRRRWWYFAVMLVLLFGAVVGQERAPWLAFLLSAAAVTWISAPGPRRGKVFAQFAVGIALIIALVAALPDLRERVVRRLAETQLEQVEKNTLLSRLAIWGVAWNLFRQHPVLGVGPKNFVTLTPSYLSFEEMGYLEAADPHNVWLGMLAEGGIIGFAAYVWLCAAIAALAWRRLRHPAWRTLQPFLLAYLGYHFFMFAMSYHYFTKGEGHFHFLMVGIMVGLIRRVERGEQSRPALQALGANGPLRG